MRKSLRNSKEEEEEAEWLFTISSKIPLFSRPFRNCSRLTLPVRLASFCKTLLWQYSNMTLHAQLAACSSVTPDRKRGSFYYSRALSLYLSLSLLFSDPYAKDPKTISHTGKRMRDVQHHYILNFSTTVVNITARCSYLTQLLTTVELKAML